MNEALQRNRLFAGVPPESLSQLDSVIEEVAFEKDELIFAEEERGSAFYLVQTGLVRISKRGRGGEQETITYVEPADFFGEMALLDANPRSARALAVEPTVTGRIDREGFQKLLALGCPEIQMNFLLQVVQRLRRVSEHFIAEMMRAERLSLVGSMAAAIIHDLNNPISVIRGCNELLERPSSTLDRAKLTLLNRKAVDQIMAMIQELLDFSRGRVPDFEPQAVTVAELLGDLEAQVLRLAPQRGLELVQRISYAGEVAVDRGRFVRALGNLAKNAMQSMSGKGTLTVAVEERDGAVLFSIVDTGGGIPPEIQARIFEPFVTVGKKDGTGLGMAIVKSVVEAHRGQIEVRSTLGEGTTVTVRIPKTVPQG